MNEKNHETSRNLAAISIATFLLMFFIGQPPENFSIPPNDFIKVVRITAHSKPSNRRKSNLIEMKAESNSDYLKWWHFLNVGSISYGVNVGDVIDISISDVDDARFGGRGYIWEVYNVSSNATLIKPEQIIKYNKNLEAKAIFIKCILTIISIISAARAIHHYRVKK